MAAVLLKKLLKKNKTKKTRLNVCHKVFPTLTLLRFMNSLLFSMLYPIYGPIKGILCPKNVALRTVLMTLGHAER